MLYIELYKLLNDAAFQQRMQVAQWIKAVEIVYENPQTQHHAARIAWASKIIKEQPDQSALRQAVIMVAGDPVLKDVGAGATDAQIQQVVSDLIDRVVV